MEQRFVVFLFDDFNFSDSDLNLAQKAASKLLEESLPESDTVAVLSSSGTNSGLTHDRAKLQQTIAGIKPNNIYRHQPNGCPNVDYYNADLILILILISPGFLTPTPEAMQLASQIIDLAARNNITINAIDSRGLYTTNLES